MDQQRFDFPDETPGRKRRARGPKPGRPVTTRKRTPVNLPLTDSPVQQACGLCGHRQTVLGDTAVCAKCGGIMVRQDPTEDE